jgi:serine/threonine protein phosphatase PrpC
MESLTAVRHWRSAALSHCGRRHSENEDSCLDRPEAGLWAVADGMGGHADGHVASRTLCHALESIPPMPSLVELERAVQSAVAETNRTLRARAASHSPSGVIGTTVAVLMIHSGYAVCAWCGDSRIYLVRGGEGFLLTRDHTLVQEMVDRGEIDHAAARFHRAAHVVARAVGVARTAELERLAIEVHDGDRFLLCTDGISRFLDIEELAGLLAEDPRAAVREAVDLAQARGTADDVTAVAVVLDGPETVA